MNDDINVAFGSLETRSIATCSGAPLDRICVRDLVKEIEIGAFQAERDTKQRIRFNVVLEVADSAAADFDDVDQVLSYDAITEAIEEQLSVERLNLLETLAERIADAILKHPRAMRVFVRIEKLDRIPGSLGIDIVRSKQVDQPSRGPSDGIDPLIVFMPNSVLYGLELSAWLDAIATHDRPAIICLQGVKEQVPTTDAAASDLRIGLMSIEQNAWVLAAKDARCVVVNNRTELDWAMKNGQLSVWAPTKIVMDAVDQPKAGPKDPLALSQWFAFEFFADQVTVLQGIDQVATTDRLLLAATPAGL
jgi:dihydroneopterin aldolase